MAIKTKLTTWHPNGGGSLMDEKITYEEMLEQLDQNGLRVTAGARRLYTALNSGIKADVLGQNGPAVVSLVDGQVIVEKQTVH